MATAAPELKPSEAQVFGSLTVLGRVLETPSRTIAIPNIAAISVGTIETSNGWLWGVGAVVAGVLGFNALNSLGAFVGGPPQIGLVLLAIAAVCAYKAFTSFDRTHYLIIATNDGTRTLFTGPKRETLDEVRRLLTAKINAGDERATYNINFQTGTIEALNVASLSAGAVVQGSNNQVGVGSPGARVASPGGDVTVANSAGVQVGERNVAKDNDNRVRLVDYGAVLPAIEQLRQHYAQFPDQGELTRRLAELEALMRAGSPGEPERAGVRKLAAELSQILQGYPPAVQLFQHIAGLAAA